MVAWTHCNAAFHVRYISCSTCVLWKINDGNVKEKWLNISTNEPIMTDTLGKHVKGRASAVRAIMPRISEGRVCGWENICVEGWSGVSVLSAGARSWQLNGVGAFDFQGAMYRFMTRVKNVRNWHSGRHGCFDCTRTKTMCLFCWGNTSNLEAWSQRSFISLRKLWKNLYLSKEHINNQTAHWWSYIPFSLCVQTNVTICFSTLFIEASSNAWLNLTEVDLTANCSNGRLNEFL